MHSTKIIGSGDFEFHCNGKESTFEGIFPNFNQRDRLGIVVSSPGGSLGASTLLMAAVTKFYDYFRSRLGSDEGSLHIYPDYYVFHIEKMYFDHHWLDIFPEHKEIVVENDPEEVLRAINDRGITRLLVEKAPGTSYDFSREAYNSALHRIDTAVAYSVSNSFEKITAQVSGPQIIEKYIKTSLKRSRNLTEDIYSLRSSLLKNAHGRIVESFQHVSLDEALSSLQVPVASRTLS